MSHLTTVLVVEDDPQQAAALGGLLESDGFDVTVSADAASAIAELSRRRFSALITDYDLPSGSGLDVIRVAHQQARRPAAILVTAYGTIPLAVEAMREGAVDVQVKPVDPAALLATLRRAIKTRDLETENATLRVRLADAFRLGGMIGESPAMRAVLEQVRRVAATQATVLITGESGTGKELVANLLHENGTDAAAPFVAVNCAALPESLLESELFGHLRGAFTGAMQDRAGRFEEAEGGTLFLDEIGEIPHSVQVRLLRVLQEREVIRLGENVARPVSFRLVSATNVDLERCVEDGQFREDLYYRLNVVRIAVPPLRERPEDIRPLALKFIHDAAERNGVRARPLSSGALDALVAYPFPGNVRQLQNVVEGALLVAGRDQVEVSDLSLPLPRNGQGEPSPEAPLPVVLDETERRLIRAALVRSDGVVSKAADVLGIPQRTLRYKMRRLGLRG